MSNFILPWYALLILFLVSILLIAIQSCVAINVSKNGDVVWTGNCKPSGLNGSGNIKVDCNENEGLSTNNTITKAYLEAAFAGEAPTTIPCTLFKERVFGKYFVECKMPITQVEK